MAIWMVLVVDLSVQGCTLSTRVNYFLPISKHELIYVTIAISANNFVEMIRFFMTLILNVDESELP